MLRLIGRRAATSIVPFLFVVIGVFALSRMTGNPASLYLPLTATPEMRANYSALHGFDQPIWRQFLDYVQDVARGDFGTSLWTGRPAMSMVLDAFPNTLMLATMAILIALVISVALGSWAAYRPNSVADKTVSTLSVVASSVPDFWFALMSILLFAVTLNWLPTSGMDGAATFVLPILTLLINPIGVLSQVTRGEMVTALSAPYVKVARSKGAREGRIVIRHVLRNALAPTVTVAGTMAVYLINGAVVVETVFGWPGVGNLTINALLQRDFATIQAAVFLIAIAIFVLNILIDVLYAAMDPRVRVAK
jgi:peptide/nickel transport system permease protein